MGMMQNIMKHKGMDESHKGINKLISDEFIKMYGSTMEGVKVPAFDVTSTDDMTEMMARRGLDSEANIAKIIQDMMQAQGVTGGGTMNTAAGTMVDSGISTMGEQRLLNAVSSNLDKHFHKYAALGVGVGAGVAAIASAVSAISDTSQSSLDAQTTATANREQMAYINDSMQYSGPTRIETAQADIYAQGIPSRQSHFVAMPGVSNSDIINNTQGRDITINNTVNRHQIESALGFNFERDTY
jgi:hypothetical protein